MAVVHAPTVRVLPIEYKDSYLALFDILGWSGRVESSRTDPTDLDLVARAAWLIRQTKDRAERLSQGVNNGPQIPIEYSWFSDTVIASSPANIGARSTLLLLVAQCAVELLSMGLYVRGAIVRGPVRHTSGVAFGPAIVEAHKLEQSVAKVPRILVTREARELAEGMLCRDSDGIEYFDVFRLLEDADPSTHKHSLQEARARVKANAEANRNNLRLLSKDMWLGNYLDEVERRSRSDPGG